MKYNLVSKDYFKNPRNMSRIIRKNVLDSSAYEGASREALRRSSQALSRPDSNSAKKRVRGS